MSNHDHTVIYDRFGRYPEFVEHFHKMFARWPFEAIELHVGVLFGDDADDE